MKVTIYDFIYSLLGMTFLWLSSWALVFRTPFADFVILNFSYYGYVLNLLVFVSIYGFLSALLFYILTKFRPLKIGSFDGDSAEFTYWKFLTMIHYFGRRCLFLFDTAPAQPFLNNIFGARVGNNVGLGAVLDSPNMISIGDNCVLGVGVIVSGNIHVAGMTTFGRVEIGKSSTIGVYTTILPNVKIGENVTVAPYSVVVAGTDIPDGETWKGNPARRWT